MVTSSCSNSFGPHYFIIAVFTVGPSKSIIIIILRCGRHLQVENEHYSTVSGLIRLVISLECFIEITPDFLCPFMND